MKKIFSFMLAMGIASSACLATSSAPTVSSASTASSSTAEPGALAPSPAMKATDVRIPVGKTGKFINLQELSTIKVADFEQLTGKKMGWFRRMEFRLAQKQLRHSINKDGTVDSKRLEKLSSGYYGDDDNSFHIGGFALGFFLGLIGILIAYLINDDNHHRRVKWAWIGFGIFIALYLVLVIAVLSSANRN